MKILHVIGSMDPISGGPCQGIRNSNTEMINLGLSREVISLDEPNATFLGSDDFPIHPMGPTKSSWQYTAKLKPWLIDNLSRFDVVIINGIWLYTSYITWKTIKTLKKRNRKQPHLNINIPKLFVMPHGMLDPYFQQAATRRLKAVRNWIYWNLIEKKVINEAHGILFTCELELELAKKTFSNYHPKNEFNIGYGIVAPPFLSASMHKSFAEKCPGLNSQPYLLFLSRVNEKKGIDLLIEAFAQIRRQAQIENKKIPALVIAGPGLESAFAKRIIRISATYPELKDAVFFTGMLTGDAKWGALYNCDAFILPSHQENFGIAVVEALACEKPVIISNQINIWMEIKEAGAGIVAPDTIEGIKSLLNQWLNLSETEISIMGKQAAAVFKDKFHIEPNSVSFLKALRS